MDNNFFEEHNHSEFSLFNDQKQPESYVRPLQAKSAINQNFSDVERRTGKVTPSYIFTGAHTYAFSINELVISSDLILDTMTQQKAETEVLKNPLQVLDEGAGDFSFVKYNQEKYNGKVEVFGIAANDNYREESERSVDKYHVLGNAEYLSDIFGKNKFDYIFSSMMYRHLFDPVGSIIEAYKTLKPGGVLMIDQFYIRGCEPFIKNIIYYLKKSGYAVIAGLGRNTVETFVIKKPSDGTKPELKFPVLFHAIEGGKVIYKPTVVLLRFDMHACLEEERKWYTDGAKVMIENAAKLNNDLLNRCNSLPELFSDSEYDLLEAQQKHLFILAVTAKSLTFDDRDRLVREWKQENSKTPEVPFGTIYNLIEKYDGLSLYMLSGSTYFNLYQIRADVGKYDRILACQQQLRIISFAAMDGIIGSQKMLDLGRSLQSMGLPSVDERKSYEEACRNCSEELTFPKLKNVPIEPTNTGQQLNYNTTVERRMH